MADSGAALLALVTGVLVARHLGPRGKGMLSELSYLVALFAPACAIGLGEAGVSLVGQRRARLQQAVSSTIGMILVVAPVGVVALAALTRTQFARDWTGLHTTVAVTAVAVVLTAVANVLAQFVEADQQLVRASVGRALIALVTTVFTFLLVVVLPKAVTGGMTAMAVGLVGGILFLWRSLARSGISVRPSLDRRYLGDALRLGFPVQLSMLVVVLAARIDLLLVHAIAGDNQTGYYSVALTLGQLSAYASVALSAASYPRLAYLPRADASAYMARLARMALATAVASGVALAVVFPVLVPLAFGRGFTPAVVPAIVLTAGGVFGSIQWVLCRACTARGRPGVFARSYGASLVVMVALDLVLIHAYGIVGAAEASVFSSAAGLGVAVAIARNGDEALGPMRDLLPGRAEFALLVRLPRDVAHSVVGAARDKR